MKTTDLKLTNMTEAQVATLKEEAKKVGLTVTGLIKMWCQEIISKRKVSK